MKKFKGIAIKKLAGVLLIVAAVAMLGFWEAKGREAVLMDEVLIATEDIHASEQITDSMMAVVSVPLNAKVSGVVYAKNKPRAVGLMSISDIPKGAQISTKMLRKEAAAGENEEAYFVIKSEWIYMSSSALRRGDEINIVSSVGEDDFGSFKVASVNENENVEILTNLSTYRLIKDFAENAKTPSLILVQRRN